jgi:hypothetical protein
MVMLAFQQPVCRPGRAGGDAGSDGVCAWSKAASVSRWCRRSVPGLPPGTWCFRPIRGLPASAQIGLAIAFHADNESAATKRLREVALSVSK